MHELFNGREGAASVPVAEFVSWTSLIARTLRRLAALDDEIAVMIARDIMNLYELVADPPDMKIRWPPDWPTA